jgi:hypothetical protein
VILGTGLTFSSNGGGSPTISSVLISTDASCRALRCDGHLPLAILGNPWGTMRLLLAILAVVFFAALLVTLFQRQSRENRCFRLRMELVSATHDEFASGK